MNLDDIPQETIIARGQYATYRGAHEDAKKRLSILCGEMSAIASQVLRYMQPDGDATPETGAVISLCNRGKQVLDRIEECATEIDELDSHRRQLKPIAWGK